MHKTENCWDGPTRQTTPAKRNANSPSQLTRSVTNPYPPRPLSQKTEITAPTIWGKSRREGVHGRGPPNRYEEDFLTECNEEPTQDWQRRWNVGMILRHNARYPKDPTPLPQWITESPDNYATLKRPLAESKTERIYINDRDYRCDPWDEPTIYDTKKLSFKIQVSNPQAQSTEITNLPSPPSPILKRTIPSPTAPVTITSTPIDAENIICIEDKTICAHQEKQKRENANLTVTPPKTAPATAMANDDVQITEYPSKLPEDLDAIKDFFQHDKNDDYIPLMSAITLKKKKRMRFLPVELNTQNRRLSRLRCVH